MNFHALELYARSRGGFSLHTPREDVDIRVVVLRIPEDAGVESDATSEPFVRARVDSRAASEAPTDIAGGIGADAESRDGRAELVIPLDDATSDVSGAGIEVGAGDPLSPSAVRSAPRRRGARPTLPGPGDGFGDAETTASVDEADDEDDRTVVCVEADSLARRRSPRLVAAFGREVGALGPDEYYHLISAVPEDGSSTLSLSASLAICKLADWEPDVVLKFRRLLASALPDATRSVGDDVARGLRRYV